MVSINWSVVLVNLSGMLRDKTMDDTSPFPNDDTHGLKSLVENFEHQYYGTNKSKLNSSIQII